MNSPVTPRAKARTAATAAGAADFIRYSQSRVVVRIKSVCFAVDWQDGCGFTLLAAWMKDQLVNSPERAAARTVLQYVLRPLAWQPFAALFSQ